MLAHNPRCLATWTNLPPRRYTNNVYHQAELVYPMLLAAAEAEDGVRIFWRFPLLSWSRGMLDLLNRRPWHRTPSWTSELIVGNRTTMPRNCLSFGPRGAGNYFNEAAREAVRSAPKLRKFVLKACNINERVVPPTPRRAIYMPRRGAGLQSCMKTGCARNLVGWRSLVHEIERAFPATAPLVVVGTPGSSMTVCSQVALWASAGKLQECHALQMARMHACMHACMYVCMPGRPHARWPSLEHGPGGRADDREVLIARDQAHITRTSTRHCQVPSAVCSLAMGTGHCYEHWP